VFRHTQPNQWPVLRIYIYIYIFDSAARR
jgi:hypothetical protein